MPRQRAALHPFAEPHAVLLPYTLQCEASRTGQGSPCQAMTWASTAAWEGSSTMREASSQVLLLVATPPRARSLRGSPTSWRHIAAHAGPCQEWTCAI